MQFLSDFLYEVRQRLEVKGFELNTREMSLDLKEKVTFSTHAPFSTQQYK